MLYEDKFGKILMQEEVEELSFWEVEDREIHVYADDAFQNTRGGYHDSVV